MGKGRGSRSSRKLLYPEVALSCSKQTEIQLQSIPRLQVENLSCNKHCYISTKLKHCIKKSNSLQLAPVSHITNIVMDVADVTKFLFWNEKKKKKKIEEHVFITV